MVELAGFELATPWSQTMGSHPITQNPRLTRSLNFEDF